MSKDKKLARNVTVAGTTYGPDDDVPDHIREQIRNPKAWIPDGDPLDEEEKPAGNDGGTAGGHKLAGAVTVGGRTYGPGDFVPDDVAAPIPNPKAWAGGKAPAKATPPAAPGGPAGSGGPAKAAPPPAKKAG